ncbi:MAG: hypothetical protein ACK5XT_05935, partial [Gemmatimonas sp.]
MPVTAGRRRSALPLALWAGLLFPLACARSGRSGADEPRFDAPSGPPGDPAIPARVAAAFPDAWRLPAGARATFAPQVMAVSNSPEASAAAAAFRRAGCNAVDADGALGLALAASWQEPGHSSGD